MNHYLSRFFDRIRHADRRLRLMVLATALLIVPLIGQALAAYDLASTGHESPLAILFMLVAIFTVPTSLIFSITLFITARHHIHEQERTLLLGALNLLLAINLVWFFVHACSWAQVAHLSLQTCR